VPQKSKHTSSLFMPQVPVSLADFVDRQ